MLEGGLYPDVSWLLGIIGEVTTFELEVAIVQTSPRERVNFIIQVFGPAWARDHDSIICWRAGIMLAMLLLTGIAGLLQASLQRSMCLASVPGMSVLLGMWTLREVPANATISSQLQSFSY